MAWTAKVIKKIHQEGTEKVEIEVEFTDGTTTITETYFLSAADSLKGVVIGKINKLENAESLATSLTKGDLDLTVTPKVPTQTEIDKNQYGLDLRRYDQIQRAVDIGILPTGSLTQMADKLSTNFQADYLELL